jgi:Na+/H+ antiporter NhaC
MKRIFSFILFICSIQFAVCSDYVIKAELPKVILKGIPAKCSFHLTDQNDQIQFIDTVFVIKGIKNLKTIKFNQGIAKFSNIEFEQYGQTVLTIPDCNWQDRVNIIPPILAVLPPFVAILLALITRQVLIALFVGIWIGVSFMYNYDFLAGFFLSITDYIAKAPADPDRMSIIIFSLVLGGMVGTITAINGTKGIVDKLSRYASNSRRGQLVTWLMGIIIFFDDYTNTLIVGNTMRALTDKLRISREKLAYLVDSTAAPVANIAIISTWIGFEIGLIDSSFDTLNITDNAYLTFIRTIPYNFYPIFALVIGFTIALLGRDFGPMYKAEIRTRKTGQVTSPGSVPISTIDIKDVISKDKIRAKWYNGILPILVVIITTIIGLWTSGISNLTNGYSEITSVDTVQYISIIIGKSNPYAVLMWAAFTGSITAIILALTQKILTLEQAILSWINGIKSMIIAAIILTLAWAIGNICIDLHVAEYLIYISKTFISSNYIPILSFLISAIISFATGTSWGVMAIVLPIVIPIAYLLPQTDPSISMVHQQSILYSTIASVLAGATFGDHCSPISDTTIMSSMSSCSDHIDHVRTQLPYAILGGIVSMIFGFLPIGFGINPFILLFSGIVVIGIIIRFYGKPVL